MKSADIKKFIESLYMNSAELRDTAVRNFPEPYTPNLADFSAKNWKRRSKNRVDSDGFCYIFCDPDGQHEDSFNLSYIRDRENAAGCIERLFSNGVLYPDEEAFCGIVTDPTDSEIIGYLIENY